jgi:histidine triad (HIT) family protein
MSADDCLFCKIVAGQMPVKKIYEDEVVLSFLDIGPISDGHTLVIPKQHFVKLHECPADLLGQVFTRIGNIAGAVAAAMDSDGYNLLCNNGRAAGQFIEHLHFHIVPRNTGDGLFNHWPSVEYEDGKIDEVTGAIRKYL